MNFAFLMKSHRQPGGRPASCARPRQPEARKQEPKNSGGGISPAQRAGSAHDTWFLPSTARKPLIIEKSATTSYQSFATGRHRFAMSLFSDHRAGSYSSLLSKLLKEKKKEGWERKESEEIGTPRVDLDLPSIGGSAYFLGHVSRESAGGDSWQLMATHPFEINRLSIDQMHPTSPRVALRVVRCGAPRRAR